MTHEQAQKVYEHLKSKGLAFCWLQSNGQFITREYLTEAYCFTF